jgi:predicted nucleic acid-binding protein
MTALRFVDTNIFLYAHDSEAGARHERARQILRELWDESIGCLSPQVLQEFYVNATRKIPRPLSSPVAREIMRCYVPWVRAAIDGEMTLRAVEISEIWQTSFWDGMIVAAAERSGASELLTEDLQHGQRVAGILIVNPFMD